MASAHNNYVAPSLISYVRDPQRHPAERGQRLLSACLPVRPVSAR